MYLRPFLHFADTYAHLFGAYLAATEILPSGANSVECVTYIYESLSRTGNRIVGAGMRSLAAKIADTKSEIYTCGNIHVL